MSPVSLACTHHLCSTHITCVTCVTHVTHMSPVSHTCTRHLQPGLQQQPAQPQASSAGSASQFPRVPSGGSACVWRVAVTESLPLPSPRGCVGDSPSFSCVGTCLRLSVRLSPDAGCPVTSTVTATPRGQAAGTQDPAGSLIVCHRMGEGAEAAHPTDGKGGAAPAPQAQMGGPEPPVSWGPQCPPVQTRVLPSSEAFLNPRGGPSTSRRGDCAAGTWAAPPLLRSGC